MNEQCAIQLSIDTSYLDEIFAAYFPDNDFVVDEEMLMLTAELLHLFSFLSAHHHIASQLLPLPDLLQSISSIKANYIARQQENDAQHSTMVAEQVRTIILSGILAVSSKEEQRINRFIDLFNTNKLPSLLNDGTMDPKLLKYYLSVHDNQDGSPEIATKTLAEMKSIFGPNDCQLLSINSSEEGPIEHQNNPWASYISDTAPSNSLDSFLNIDDINEIHFWDWRNQKQVACLEDSHMDDTQVNQLLQVAQKGQSTISEAGSDGVSQQDWQTSSNM